MTDACIVCLEDLEVAVVQQQEEEEEEKVGVPAPVPAPILVVQDPQTHSPAPRELERGTAGKEPGFEQSLRRQCISSGKGAANGNDNNALCVAQIKPCDHVLHDHCLREWSQKANSCPICRASFNLVLVLDGVGGKLSAFFIFLYFAFEGEIGWIIVLRRRDVIFEFLVGFMSGRCLWR